MPLLFDPKNARRIFYVHINWLLVHIGAFDPVHIGLLLSVKLSTAWTRSIKAAAMVVTVPPGNEGPRARRSAGRSGGNCPYEVVRVAVRFCTKHDIRYAKTEVCL
jgi:hypothetical protein